ncbi:THAP domain-containing protein 2-like [Manduca sexta]|uniref:THAP domain-containing protein 2-like n=1 Tax=Manduca sexta TaxID=7130 RepID=UPI00188FA36E|nr:THAP domain-containing protein 2-like [Manduca sexta]
MLEILFYTERQTKANWIENIGRRDWNPTSNSYICSLHFEENCINHTLKVPRVKDNCFPTIFPQGIGQHIYEQNELNTTGCLSQQHVIAVDELNSQASTSKEYPLQLKGNVFSSTTHNIKWDHSYASSSTQQVSTVIIQKMKDKIKMQQNKSRD